MFVSNVASQHRPYIYNEVVPEVGVISSNKHPRLFSVCLEVYSLITKEINITVTYICYQVLSLRLEVGSLSSDVSSNLSSEPFRWLAKCSNTQC
ncbi:hypothetical protein TNCV_3707981 [Trichonephila clavipes]|nr:hypothetical protein TNCV_3707981 [Trichonephila clavipes]